jgi:hypothetical protein
MVGYHHGDKTLHQDPALVKYSNMWVKRHEFFRITPRTGFVSFMYIVAFPAFIGYLAYTTDGKWDPRGKRRGDPVAEF